MTVLLCECCLLMWMTVNKSFTDSFRSNSQRLLYLPPQPLEFMEHFAFIFILPVLPSKWQTHDERKLNNYCIRFHNFRVSKCTP